MNTATFNALQVVDGHPDAMALGIGTEFLFSDDATPGVNSQQNRSVGEPGINRVTYYRRIEADRTDGPYPLGIPNSTQFSDVNAPSGAIWKNGGYIPPSAGGPFPPLAPSGTAYAPDQGCCPDPLVSEVIPATSPIPYAELSYPPSGSSPPASISLKGQGRVGYVRIYDVLT